MRVCICESVYFIIDKHDCDVVRFFLKDTSHQAIF